MTQEETPLTRAEKQRESARALTLNDVLVARIERYADDNSMSRSQAVRELMEMFIDGKLPKVPRRRQMRRLSVWVDPVLYRRFVKKTEDSSSTIALALESALDMSEED